MPVQPESKFVEANGLRIHYLDWGNAGAPAVVCVHGLGGAAEGFNGFARHFRDRFHILAVDIRGHGESEWSPQGAYEYADEATDLTDFVAALGLDRFTLVGTSMGGRIAMTYATTQHEHLDRLVLNDIGPDEEPGMLRITQNTGARPSSFPNLEEAMAYRAKIQLTVARRTQEDQRELALSVLQQASDGTWTWKQDPAIAAQRVARGRGPLLPPIWPTFATLECPTLVVWGMDSDVLSETQAKRMVSTLPHGTLLPVPGTPHAPTLIEPEAVAGLEAFLAIPVPAKVS